ncbi:MAG: tRNA (guanine(37)-N(1))-methyltransferase, partial [Candidatus Methylacidiphilales bacterium]
MRIDVITLFPEILRGALDVSILKRAQAKGLVQIYLHQLREYALDKHRTVDDRPFGGGPGMLLKCEPMFRAVEAVRAMTQTSALASDHAPDTDVEALASISSDSDSAADKAKHGTKTVLFSAGGRLFDQSVAREWSKLDRLILICGHYEGVDERIREQLADDEISIGN